MNQKHTLIALRLLHTIIWVFLSSYVFYILFAAIMNKIDITVWIGVGLVFLEGITLLIFKWTCPITIWVKNVSVNYEENTDIYLPKWLAKNTKLIFTTLFVLALLIIVVRIFLNI